MKTSQLGIDLIKREEGLSLGVYKDTASKATIGYGHLIRKGEMFHTITQEEADELLASDVTRTEGLVNRFVNLTVTSQNQYDAWVSFVFNLGRQAFVNEDGSFTRILKLHNAGDFKGAADEFRLWIFSGGKMTKGLQNRRKREVVVYRGVT